MSFLKLIFQFLPELIGLITALGKSIQAGVEVAQLKRDLKNIEKAFDEKQRSEAARLLNDVFKH